MTMLVMVALVTVMLFASRYLQEKAGVRRWQRKSRLFIGSPKESVIDPSEWERVFGMVHPDLPPPHLREETQPD